MRRFSTVIACAFAVALMAFAVGCGDDEDSGGASGAAGGSSTTSSGGEGKKLRIAALIGDTANSWEAAELEGLKEGAKKHGAEITKVFNGKFDAQTQVRQIQDAISSGQFDALAIVANDGGAITPDIKRAIEQKLLVACMLVACGPDPAGSTNQIPGMVTTVGFAYKDNGKMIGELAVEACGDKNPCNVVYMPGLLSLPLDTARLDGFKEALATNPNIKIVAQQEGEYVTGKARSVMENILQKHKDVHVAAAAQDAMVTGIEQALKSAGVKQKVALIGSGGSTTAAKAICEDRWYGTVAGVPFTEGVLAVKYLVEASQGKKVPDWVDEYQFVEGGPKLTGKRACDFKAEWTD
jgi:ribose transport system substrate-binding protein